MTGADMRISFFGSLAEAIGREVDLAIPAGHSVADVRRILAGRYPAAAPILSRPGVRACLDDDIVDDDEIVAEGAELAFLPPLSGG